MTSWRSTRKMFGQGCLVMLDAIIIIIIIHFFKTQYISIHSFRKRSKLARRETRSSCSSSLSTTKPQKCFFCSNWQDFVGLAKIHIFMPASIKSNCLGQAFQFCQWIWVSVKIGDGKSILIKSVSHEVFILGQTYFYRPQWLFFWA